MAIGLAIAGTAAAVASTGAQVYQGYVKGKAAKKAAEYNSQILIDNAKQAESQADEVVREGFSAQSDFYREFTKLQGRQAAARASSGVVGTSGSALDLISETLASGEIQMGNMLAETEKKKEDLLLQSKSYRAKAGAVKLGIQDYGFGDFAGTVLSGAPSIVKGIGNIRKAS